MKYQRILSAVREIPWAILPSKLAAVMEFLELKAAGRDFTAEELESRTGSSSKPSNELQMFGSVAVIPVMGVLSQRINLTRDISDPGGTSTEMLSKQIRQALADPEVNAIALNFDSPGGTVYGIPELAGEILRARTQKKISAVVNPMAASAAYWLASQTNEIVMTPSGQAGSIGVFMAHDDYSKWMENEGVKTTYIAAGRYKTEGNPTEPLTEEARAHYQGQVDKIYDMFTKGVAKGRNVPVSVVRGDWGEGRMLLAKDAVSAGMADRVATLDETLARLNGPAGRLPARSAAAQISTIRDYEAFLRDAGFSIREAKTLASPFSSLEDQRDVEPAEGTAQESEPDESESEVQSFLSWVREQQPLSLRN